MKKDISEWTREEFDKLPWREERNKEFECTSIVILPLRKCHSSGFRLMDFVACNGGVPICRCSDCSDVIHIDGIGGYGKWSVQTGLPKSIKPRAWSIDCLKKSGLLHLWPNHGKMIIGAAYSSFEVFFVPNTEVSE